MAAVVLGTGGGVVTGLVTTSEPGPEVGAVADPLNLGVPLDDQPCSGESLLVVGIGDGAAPLVAAVADQDPDEVRYLRTDDSCPTIYGTENLRDPDYVAYLGPFPTMAPACAARMTPEHRGDFVTRLRDGNDIFVRCVCVLPDETGPVLRPGMESDATTSIWIRQLQGLLNELDPEAFPTAWVNGVYDERTQARIEDLQARAQIGVDGVVDAQTWGLVRDRTCDRFDF